MDNGGVYLLKNIGSRQGGIGTNDRVGSETDKQLVY